MGKDSPEAPAPRDINAEISAILNQGPALLRSEQQISPQSATLDLSNLDLALKGSPAGTRYFTTQERAARTGWYDEQGNFISPGTYQAGRQQPGTYGALGRIGEGYIPGEPPAPGAAWRTEGSQFGVTRSEAGPAVPGLLEQLGTTSRAISGLTNEQNTGARRATYADLRELNPGQASLYDLLNQTATADLAAGDRLPPELAARIRNDTYGNYRGFAPGGSPADAEAILNYYGAGQQLKQQRISTAGNVAELGSRLYTNPAVAFAPNPVGTAQQFMGFGGGYSQQPNILQQLGGYGGDLFNTNFNSQAAANINQANANNATTNTAVTAAAALAAAGIAACWAAREVFGVNDERWLRFRQWVFDLAPERFRQWYLVNGEQWAARLRRQPATKITVRRWMLKRIHEWEMTYAV